MVLLHHEVFVDQFSVGAGVLRLFFEELLHGVVVEGQLFDALLLVVGMLAGKLGSRAAARPGQAGDGVGGRILERLLGGVLVSDGQRLALVLEQPVLVIGGVHHRVVPL